MVHNVIQEMQDNETKQYRLLCARHRELRASLEVVTDARTKHDIRLTMLAYQDAIANFHLTR